MFRVRYVRVSRLCYGKPPGKPVSMFDCPFDSTQLGAGVLDRRQARICVCGNDPERTRPALLARKTRSSKRSIPSCH